MRLNVSLIWSEKHLKKEFLYSAIIRHSNERVGSQKSSLSFVITRLKEWIVNKKC